MECAHLKSLDKEEKVNMNSDRITNKVFSETDETFKLKCRAIEINHTKRQASKWRNKKGILYKVANGFEYNQCVTLNFPYIRKQQGRK
jgi:hypothetical protein